MIAQGDNLWTASLKGDPDDQLYLASSAQDIYRDALRLATGRDVEIEGEIVVKLARFFDLILRLPPTAHAMYLRAVQLASALSPMLPTGKWYADAVDAVQKHRDELASKETRQWHEMRKPYLEILKVQIDELEAEDKKLTNDWDFAKWLWVKHPPKTPGSCSQA